MAPAAGFPVRHTGNPPGVRKKRTARGAAAWTVSAMFYRLGLRSAHCEAMSMGAVALCLGLWVRAKTVDQQARGNAERRALFTGLWPPTLWLIGVALRRYE